MGKDILHYTAAVEKKKKECGEGKKQGIKNSIV